MDTSVFGKPVIKWTLAPIQSELSRLALYRLGLNGTWVKYRVVPRSAIVAHADLVAKVHDDDGEGSTATLIENLWRDHGAPSPAIVQDYLAAANRVDQLEPGPDRASARRDLLDAWLRACAPRSAAGRLRDVLELGVCWVFRQTRKFARSLAASRR